MGFSSAAQAPVVQEASAYRICVTTDGGSAHNCHCKGAIFSSNSEVFGALGFFGFVFTLYYVLSIYRKIRYNGLTTLTGKCRLFIPLIVFGKFPHSYKICIHLE